MSDTLIDRIYEASALPERWPAVLHDLATVVGAHGMAVFGANGTDQFQFVAPAIAELFAMADRNGWLERNERIAPLVAAMPPQFVTDTHYRTAAELATLPIYRDFLIPLGMENAAGTIFSGVCNDLVVVTAEGFASEAAARASLPLLDELRPHLGRALTLTARLQLERARAMVDGLAAIGAPAAVTDGKGRLRACNDSFSTRLGGLVVDRRERLSFTDRTLDQRFADLLTGPRSPARPQSLLVRPGEDEPPCVMHIIPLRRDARDVMNADGLLMLLAEARNDLLPTPDLLRLLFDLTPTEARLTRRLLEGRSLAEAAGDIGIAYATARVHLRTIFDKTDTSRQADLVRLLAHYSQPVGDGSIG